MSCLGVRDLLQTGKVLYLPSFYSTPSCRYSQPSPLPLTTPQCTHIVYSCLWLCVVSRFSSVFTFYLVSLLMFSSLYIHCHLLKILSYPTCTQLKITKSTATQSRRSEVINLSSEIPSLSYESVCSAISSKFYDVHGVTQNRKVQCTYIRVFVTILLELCSRDHYYAKNTCVCTCTYVHVHMYMYVQYIAKCNASRLHAVG